MWIRISVVEHTTVKIGEIQCKPMAYYLIYHWYNPWVDSKHVHNDDDNRQHSHNHGGGYIYVQIEHRLNRTIRVEGYSVPQVKCQAKKSVEYKLKLKEKNVF